VPLQVKKVGIRLKHLECAMFTGFYPSQYSVLYDIEKVDFLGKEMNYPAAELGGTGSRGNHPQTCWVLNSLGGGQ
jgi:hypothetical protein